MASLVNLLMFGDCSLPSSTETLEGQVNGGLFPITWD